MKRVHIIYSGLGGHFDYVFNLTKQMNGAGETHFIFLGIENVPQYYVNMCMLNEITFTCIKKKGFGFRAAGQLIRVILKLNPALIYIHSNAALLPAQTAARKTKSKIIFVEHQNNSLKNRKDWRRSAFAQNKSDAVIFLSDFHMNEFASTSRATFSSAKSLVIETGIPESFFATGYHEKRKHVIGMQSRLVPIKDHATLIEAFASVNLKFTEAELWIAGEGTELERLKQIVNEKKLSDKIIFNGMLSKPELQIWFSDISLYVHATFGETSSIALMEAMAQFLPVIASDVPGISSLEKGHAIVFTPPGNASQLAEKIIKVLSDQALQQNLGVQNGNYAIHHFTLAAMAESYLQFESSILALK